MSSVTAVTINLEQIYRQGQEKEILQAPTHLSGEQVLPAFVLELKGIL